MISSNIQVYRSLGLILKLKSIGLKLRDNLDHSRNCLCKSQLLRDLMELLTEQIHKASCTIHHTPIPRRRHWCFIRHSLAGSRTLLSFLPPGFQAS